MTHATTTTPSDSAGATEQAKEKVSEVAGQAKEQASQAAGQAKGKINAQVDQRSTQAGQQVKTQAQDLQSVAQSLREQGKDKPAELAEKAAQRAQSLGSYLEESSADKLLGDVEDFARKQPWAVGLGAAALGFAAARFLKASSEQRYETRSTSLVKQPARQPMSATPVPPRTDYGTFGNGTTVGTEQTLPPSGTTDPPRGF